MSLLNPLGLLGLLSLPVIVGLHVHMLRNQKAIVSSLFLWAFLDKKLQGHTARRINISWLLVLDLLIASFFSLALAQPQLEIESPLGRDRQVIILLDVSTSMLATDVNPSRFAAAKGAAAEILNGLGPNEIAAVIAIGNEVSLVGDTREISPPELNGLLENLAAGGSGVDLEAGLAYAQTLEEVDRPLSVYVITDGAFRLDHDEPLPDWIQWRIVGQAGNNQAVSDVQLREIGTGEFQAFAVLHNFSVEERAREIHVIVNGEEVRRTEITMPPLSETPYFVSLRGEVDYVQLALTGGDLLVEDDFAGAGRSRENLVSVALVTDYPDPFDRALEAVPNVVFDILPPAQFDSSVGYEVTIFRGFLPEEWPEGLALVVEPPDEGDLVEIGSMVEVNGPLVNDTSPLTEGLDYSGVRWGRVREVFGWEGAYPVLTDADGDPLILQSEFESSTVVLFLPVLDLGNVIRHPFFPLFISNLVDMGRERSLDQSYALGETLILSQAEDGLEFGLTDPAGLEVSIPESGQVQLSQTGQYVYYREDALGSLTDFRFGVNAGDEVESRIRPGEWTQEIDTGDDDYRGRPSLRINLTPWVMGIGLILLIVEAWRAWR